MAIEPVGTRISRWGEGPVWHSGRLWHVDIEGQEIISVDPAGGTEQSWNAGQRAGFVVPCRSGRFIYGGDNGLFFLDASTGRGDLIHDPEPHLPSNRFNDGKCSPNGRLFAGTIATDRTPGAASLYRLDCDLKISRVYGPVTNSNGLAWSADARTCYYIDTPTRSVKAFDHDPATGSLENERICINTAAIDASPDGMTIDTGGNLWIAFCHGARVVQYDPATGKELRTIPLPCRETTSCTFGGDGLDILYVTTGLHETEKEALAGRLMAVTGLGAQGRPTHLFAD